MEPRSDRVELANQCFSDALNLPAGERLSFVRNACSSDSDLCDNVLRLLSQFDRLGDFLEVQPSFALLAPRRELRSGDLLAERFRIVDALGRGGMGDVYRADDLTLGELVALKMVRADYRLDPVALSRFRDEIRFARRISHPNVCKTFDLFEALIDERKIAFFTMEFLDGETLAQILSRDETFEPDAALEIARGVAEGLDAAHREGVVHRDLKPANIIITARGRETKRHPVITDFGLAKAAGASDAATHHTATRQLIGTPDYMAPEQFLEEAVTPSTDVFAFGLIVYRMVAGRLPFPSENVVRSAVGRVLGKYDPLSIHAPSVPAHWDAAIARALEPDPRKRLKSAGELVTLLESPSAANQKSGAPVASISRPVPRRAMWSLLAGGSLAASAVFLRYKTWEHNLPAEPLLMLVPFTHAIEPPDATVAAGTLDFVLANQLQQSSQMHILSSDRVRSSWERINGASSPLPGRLEPATARDIALREGAQFVLFGNISHVGDDRVVQLRLELMGNDPNHARRVWPKDFAVQSDADLPSAMYDGAQWVRRTMGEPDVRLELHNRRPEELTTSSWQALKEYTLAEQAWRIGNSDAAILHLHTAIDLDNKFAWAFGRLADMLLALNRQDEGLPYYGQAAELMRQKNLTDRESLRIQGLFALDTGQYLKAEEIFSRYILEYPGDGLPLFYKAGAVSHLGRPEESLRLLDMSIEREPNRYSYRMGRAIGLLASARFEDARQECERAAKLNHVDWTDQMRGALAFARSDAAGVRASLVRLKTAGSLPFQSKTFGLEACWHAEHGQFSKAEASLRNGLRFDRETNRSGDTEISKLRLLALLFLHQARTDAAIQICHQMLDGQPGIQTQLEAGALLARAGDISGARRSIPEHLPKNPPAHPRVLNSFLGWPIYWRRLLLLWSEMALRSAQPQLAFDLLKDAPPAEIPQEWPTTLVRASVACGENHTAILHLNRLFANPGSFWFHADFTGPAFMREAIATASRLGNSVENPASLRQFLNQSN